MINYISWLPAQLILLLKPTEKLSQFCSEGMFRINMQVLYLVSQ